MDLTAALAREHTAPGTVYSGVSEMAINRVVILAVVMACGVITTACRSANEILTIDDFDLDRSDAVVLHIAPGLVLDAIDCDTSLHGRSTKDRPLTVRMRPGKHTLTLRYRSESGSDPAYVTIITTTEIYTEPGVEYSVGFALSGDTWTPNILKHPSESRPQTAK
jgi:hypothetical protein